MAPPAKRRKRNTVVASDDDAGDNSEYDGGGTQTQSTNTLANFLIASPGSPSKTRRQPTASPSPVKITSSNVNKRVPSNNTKTKTTSTNGLARRPQNKKSVASPSPKKSGIRDFLNGDERGKSADLKTLFSKQAQNPPKPRQASVPIEDLISDPISEEDDISEIKSSSISLVGQHARKRARDASSQDAGAAAPTASQRFLKPPKPAVPDDDLRPWSERFGPKNLDELVVHKKKVSDVRRWLEDVLNGRLRQRILILKGPAGSAKTTTLRLLANEMGLQVLEWKNPANNTSTGFVSSSAKFDEFLGRSGKFGALEMDDDVPTPSMTPSSSWNADAKANARRLMLIEEFPNTFSRSSSALTSFRSSILSYLSTHTPSLASFGQKRRAESIQPVVIIISETLLTTTSASADSFTAHRLLGPEILRHPGLAMVEFNPVAPTLLAKALELVVQKESRKSGRRRTPGPLVLKQLGEIGDIRNAISSLEFLCLKGDQEADWGAKVTFTKPKKGVRDGIGLTKGEADSLELISQREASLGIFHAVGKVVYNKREKRGVHDCAEDLPAHLSHFSRPKKSEVSVDSLIDETGTDTHTFISALHENYAPSCESSDPMDLSTPMDYLNDCIEALSVSDLLCPSRDVFFGGRGFTGGQDSASHVLRQEEITFQVAVRGMLFSLPHPVQRKMPTKSRGGDAFKMFYPTSLKLWREKEELEGLIDVWSSKLLRGDLNAGTKDLTDGAGAFRKPSQQGDTLSWMQRQQKQRLEQKLEQQQAKKQDEDGDPPPILSLGSAARREMVLERLPYMAQMARGSSGKSAIRLRDLEKVVSFKGIAAPDDESDSDETEPVATEAWATDKPSEEASPRKKSAGVKTGNVTGLLAQKLVLSDDDIED
jgi:cell cycle checkpoint protein